MTDSLNQQIAFIVELDKLKQILRQTWLVDRSRHENSAEHSWHVAVMALTLREYAPQPIDINRVVAMLLLHDVVEIDAGDTFAFDQTGYLDKAEREQRAAERVFGLLPVGQGQEFRALWEEFEAIETAEARFANALDRLEPLLQNARTNGGSWRVHGITRAQVLRRMQPIEEGVPRLWPYVLGVIEQCCADGDILPDVSVEAKSVK